MENRILATLVWKNINSRVMDAFCFVGAGADLQCSVVLLTFICRLRSKGPFTVKGVEGPRERVCSDTVFGDYSNLPAYLITFSQSPFRLDAVIK